MLHEFRTRRGLYVLGAGASAPDVPFGSDLMTAPALDYVRNSGSFPAVVPDKAPLTRRIVAEARKVPLSLVHPDREIRPGTDDFPYLELIERLPDFHARLHMKQLLAAARFSGRRSDGYRVFRLFRRGMIADYNHDGLAYDACRRFHKVIEMHGGIEAGFGSPRMAEIIAEAREYDLPVPSDDLLMCAPESPWDVQLSRRLLDVGAFRPEVIVVIGYSFGRGEAGFDDAVSLDFLLRSFRNFPGNVYVINPNPYDLQHLLADGLRSRKVVGVPAFWNVLAHAMMVKATGARRWKPLNYTYQRILGDFGSNVSFPRPRD
jgi:hypothetical protein